MMASDLNLVPLRQASLCLDCETITAAHTTCLACGSQALLNIARALDQQPARDTACRVPGTVVSMPSPAFRQRDSFFRGVTARTRVCETALPIQFRLSATESGA